MSGDWAFVLQCIALLAVLPVSLGVMFWVLERITSGEPGKERKWSMFGKNKKRMPELEKSNRDLLCRMATLESRVDFMKSDSKWLEDQLVRAGVVSPAGVSTSVLHAPRNLALDLVTVNRRIEDLANAQGMQFVFHDAKEALESKDKPEEGPKIDPPPPGNPHPDDFRTKVEYRLKGIAKMYGWIWVNVIDDEINPLREVGFFYSPSQKRGSSPISIMDLRFSENFVKVTLAAVKELGGEGEE